MTDFSCDFAMNYTDADVTGTETYMEGAKWNGATWDILNIDVDLNEISGTVTGFGDFSAISKLMQDFTVTVFDYNASLLEGATVDFDVLSQTTIADGTASFSVPVATESMIFPLLRMRIVKLFIPNQVYLLMHR